MKFERKDLESGSVTYTLLDDFYPLVVIATSRGVRVAGTSPSLTTQDQIDELVRIMEWGLRHHSSILETGSPISQEVLDQELIE